MIVHISARWYIRVHDGIKEYMMVHESTCYRLVARIFRGGCKRPITGTIFFNVGMIRYTSSKDTHAEWPTYGQTEIGTTFNGTGKISEQGRHEPLGGSGGMPPRKFSNLKALKRHFQHSQANSYVKKVLKIDRYFLLNFDKKSIVRCHQLQYIFIIKNYCHASFNAHKIRY